MNGPVTPSLTDTVLTDEKRMAIVRRQRWQDAAFHGVTKFFAATSDLEREVFMKGTLGSGHTERGLVNPRLQFTSAL